MSYYFSKTLNLSFDKTIAGVTEELKKGLVGTICGWTRGDPRLTQECVVR